MVKLAMAQAEAVRYDKDANLARAEELMDRASSEGAHAILFPEMFLTGYTVWDRVDELAEPLEGSAIRRLADLARRFRLGVVCGFPERRPGSSPYNSACVIGPDGTVIGAYRKTHLFDREPEFFSPGEALPVFDTPFGPIGVAICYDLEFPEAARVLAMRGARVVLNPTANMEPYAEYQAVYLRARAMENGIHVAAANTVGDDGTYVYFGESAAIDPQGRVLCRAGSGEELLIAELDLEGGPADQNLEYLRRRRPDLYRSLAE
jgi:predicted amidohydrolase